ncbi:hypothetical protein SKAU_G00055570 [Synaphobranchus kaupii]|uniref:Uncharacterized protein n=1 Tax=Synaphobranchus kaupii TaxID=118154 RepID=A0A9Q1G3V6_SYNKA|nr:hypothetical protein SKAU_G00055570 [Synaphobranchus kaupii]
MCVVPILMARVSWISVTGRCDQTIVCEVVFTHSRWCVGTQKKGLDLSATGWTRLPVLLLRVATTDTAPSAMICAELGLTGERHIRELA